ncbi:MAG: L,D-transpeptidase family protein [Lachnospiraceae bacterium]|nr:L,D-transpeptidase family protein [Lachnospiraceae bacterium]
MFKRIIAVCILTGLVLSGCASQNFGIGDVPAKGHQVLIPAGQKDDKARKDNPDNVFVANKPENVKTDEASDAASDEATDSSAGNGNAFDVSEYLVAKKNTAGDTVDEEDESLELFDTGNVNEDTVSGGSVEGNNSVETGNNNGSKNNEPEAGTASLNNAANDGIENVKTDMFTATGTALDNNTTSGTGTASDSSNTTGTGTAGSIPAGTDTATTPTGNGKGPVNTSFNDTEHLFDYSTLHFDEDTFEQLAPTVNMSFAELIGDNGDYTFPEGYPEAGTYRIVVDIYHQVVMVFTKDENGRYTVPERYMLCSSGGDNSPSPLGTFKMRSYRVRFGLFRNTDSYAQYWSLISGRIYFHTTLYSEHDGSTYTDTYKDLGTNCSHGCIRLTVPDAKWIWYHCAPGTVVEIRKGSKKEKEIGLIRDHLILADYPEKRMELKPADIPDTDNWKVKDIPHDVEFVQGSQE